MAGSGKLKRLLIGIIILASLCFLLWMAVPALVGLPFPLGGFMCKGGENVCVKIDVAEPILPDKPTSNTITVFSLNDIPELHVTLSYWPSLDVTIEEEPDQPSPMQGGVAWISSVQPFHRITYTRKFHLPRIEGEYIPGQSGGYQLIDFKASIWIPGHNPINNGLIIFVTSQGGKVYHSGEHIPITPGPEPTPAPSQIPTIYPTLTPIPTATPYIFPTP